MALSAQRKAELRAYAGEGKLDLHSINCDGFRHDGDCTCALKARIFLNEVLDALDEAEQWASDLGWEITRDREMGR